MDFQRLQELVNQHPPLTIVDGNVVHYYNNHNNQSKVASLSADLLLEMEDEEVVVSVLETLLSVPIDERRMQELEDMQRIVNNAARYIYLRDEMLVHMKRGELVDPLQEYFYNEVDIKYPIAEDYDNAIDALIKRRTS